MTKERIIIIDGSSYIFRAFYAIQKLTTSKGLPSNATYGFINMLLKVLEVEKPEKLLIAFDTPKPTFRKKIFDGYKSNRMAPPEDLVQQIPYIFRVVDAFRIQRLDREGFEADDIIATVARRAKQNGYRVEIITGDKDLMQLVDADITLFDTMKERRIDVNGVLERFGVGPPQMADLLALMGDSSDNIPGVSGIGEKTAAELIREFGSLDGVYSRIGSVKQPKRRATLLEEKQRAYLSRELATVKSDVPLEFQWADLTYSGPDRNRLKELLEELEFQNLLKRLDFKIEEKEFTPAQYTCVDSEEKLKILVRELKEAPFIVLDTETTSLKPRSAKLVGLSFCTRSDRAYYVPIGHYERGRSECLLANQLPEKVLKDSLATILEDPTRPKVGQNLKYDDQILRTWGVKLGGVQGDTLIVSYLLDPDKPHNLDNLAFRHLKHQNVTYSDVTGKGKTQINFGEVGIEEATRYSAEDADVTFRLYEKLHPELKEKGLLELYEKVELPLMGILADMEYEGVLVDREKLNQMSKELLDDIATVETQVYEAAGGAFNINSPKQLSHVLFEKLKLPMMRKTKTGVSTDERVLEHLASQHAICELILKYRALNKLKSTYVEGLLTEIDPNTHRVHTNYNQTVAATGRLSSSHPNLQNIPAGTAQKYNVRSTFIAGKGNLLLSADYSQVELRLLAHCSEDPELIAAFERDEDVHEHTARLIFGVQEITPEQRKIAKTINFGVIYGQSAYGLSQMLKITPHESKAFIDSYFTRYHRVREFLESKIQEAKKKGYVTTLLGRRRYFPEIESKNKMRREMAERAAINAPIQGTAADLIKLAMIQIAVELKSSAFQSRMILQVHDELVLEVPEKEKDSLEKMVRKQMESALPLKIPLKVDIASGKNWSECS